MKKLMALVLALLMAFALCGCTEKLPQIELPPFPEVTPTPVPAALNPENPAQEGSGGSGQQAGNAGAVIPEQAENGPRILATFQHTQIDQYDPNEGTELILSFSYDVLRLISEERPEAIGKINEYLATVEDCFQTGNDNGLDLIYLGFDAMLEAAEDNYNYVMGIGTEDEAEEEAETETETETEAAEESAEETEGETEEETDRAQIGLEYSDSLTAHVYRLDERVFSVSYAETSFTGGAHGNYGAVAFNFDLETGDKIGFDQLSEDPEGLRDYLVGLMLEMAESDEDNYFSQRIVDSFLPEGGREEAFRSLLREGSWFFDRDGLVIVSSLYELGPYAAGTVDFHIPYEMLEGKMDSRWMYSAERTGKGRIKAEELSALNGGELEIIDKLTVSGDGQELGLVAEGTVYDVTISSVYYVDRFYEKCQLWCANSLSDCALQLQTVVPEGLPDLQIVYYTADGVRHGKLLSQSGVDGSYMLVDDDIQAVG